MFRPRSTESANNARRAASRRRAMALATSVAALALGLTACGDDEGTITARPDATTTEAPASTTSTTTTTAAQTTTTAAPQDVVSIWPPSGGTTSYTDPVEAATAFAVDLVGFTDPIVGEFMQGDSRSGEVEIRPEATGPVTTVLVRLDATDRWVVLAAATANVNPSPVTALTPTSVHLTGVSTAFEATVNVRIFDRSGTTPLIESFVMGGANGEMGPFDATVEFPPPTTPDGVVVFTVYSMKDGSVWEAAALPVTFG